MKLAIGLIFSLLLAGGLTAECTQLEASAEARNVWAEYCSRFRAIVLPQKFSLCVGKKYFYQVKGGTRMASALDRQRTRIILRQYEKQQLRHELAHLYLDAAWRVLPYGTSERLVEAMQLVHECRGSSKIREGPDLQIRWRNRTNLNGCELEILLRDILAAPNADRDALPLN